MPLNLCESGKKLIVKKIGASSDIRHHLYELGFNIGSEIIIINKIHGDLIVKIKESRIAMNKSMAEKIVV